MIAICLTTQTLTSRPVAHRLYFRDIYRGDVCFIEVKPEKIEGKVRITPRFVQQSDRHAK